MILEPKRMLRNPIESETEAVRSLKKTHMAEAIKI
jgi:hypothetical protein